MSSHKKQDEENIQEETMGEQDDKLIKKVISLFFRIIKDIKKGFSIKNINAKCKHYAPLLQVIGLTVAILVLLNNTDVLSTMKASLDFEKNKYIQSQKQNWIFSVENDTKNNTKKLFLKAYHPK